MFYKYDLQTKEYTGSSGNAYYKLNGKLLDGYTKVKLPEFTNDEICKFIDGKWQVSAKPKDYRGTWINIDSDIQNITELNVIPKDGYAKENNNKWYFADGSLATDITLKHLKKTKKQEIENIYNQKLQQPITYNVGGTDYIFQADAKSQNILNKVIVAAPDDFTTNWLDIDNNFIQMALSDLKGLAQTILNKGQQLFMKKVQLKKQVDEATTKEDVEAIEWESVTNAS